MIKTFMDIESMSLPEIEKNLEGADGESRVDLLNKLAALVGKSDKVRCRKITSDAFELSKKLGYPSGEAFALFGFGDAALLDEDYRSAQEHYAKALKIFQTQKDSVQKGRCLRRLGDVHFYLNNLNLSLKYYMNALKVFEDTIEINGSSRAKRNLGHLMATIGNVLLASGDLEGSLNYFHRCHSIYIHEGFFAGIPGVLYNTGNVFYTQGRIDKALNAYKQALAEAETNNDGYLISMVLNSLGSVYLDREEFDTARDYFNKSMSVAEEQDRKRGMLAVLKKLIELDRRQGKLDEALDLTEKAEQYAEQLNDRMSYVNILRERALIFKDMAEYEKAIEMIFSYEKFRDELLSEQRIKELDLLRIRYETEAKEHKIELLKKDKVIQKRMIVGAVMGLAVAGVSLILAFRNVRFRIKVNRELAEAYSKVEKLSQIDTLTGLANRRAMMNSLEHEQIRSVRTGRSFGLIMGDIDDFKQVNDCYGHSCGDEVLVEVAHRLKKALRNQDIASRWGGEEFLLLLPETSLQGAVKVAEKTRALIEDFPFKWNNVSINLTMTFGVTGGGGIPIDNAIQLADTALYQGKENGKNSVIAQ